jgi:putative DNA primase/helicase
MTTSDDRDPGFGFRRHCDEADLNRLAALTPLEYGRVRKQEARALAISLQWLDKAVADQRKKNAVEAQTPQTPAALYPHWIAEPSDKPIDGGALLRKLTERIRQNVVLTKEQATAVALWITLTWVHEQAAVHRPILLVTSAEPNSGKSTLLGLLGFLVRRSLLSVTISGPALFRSIEKWGPTFVLDEADTSLSNNEDLKEVINSGWTRGQSVIRCDPETNDPRAYPTFCPKAIGMKGRKLPDTTLSRCVIIEMKRKLPTETVMDFNHLDDPELASLRGQLARWADDNGPALSSAAPEIPPGFHNRKRANWKLLLAIAEAAGGDWKKLAAQTARSIEKVKATFETSIGVQLLSNIKKLFESNGQDCMTSQQMVADLIADPEHPWAEYRNGRPLSQKQLANPLNGYGIYSETIHPAGLPHAKGYRPDQFTELFDRYLASSSGTPDGKSSSEPCNRANDCGTGTFNENRTVRGIRPHGSENADLSYSHAVLHGCTVPKAQNTGGAGVIPRQGDAAIELRQCAQCNGKIDGTERLHKIGVREVWLHPECKRFWTEGGGWGVRL